MGARKVSRSTRKSGIGAKRRRLGTPKRRIKGDPDPIYKRSSFPKGSFRIGRSDPQPGSPMVIMLGEMPFLFGKCIGRDEYRLSHVSDGEGGFVSMDIAGIQPIEGTKASLDNLISKRYPDLRWEGFRIREVSIERRSGRERRKN